MKVKSWGILRLAVFCLGTLMLLFGWMLINLGIDERETDKQFQLHGVQTPATLIGYRYFKGARNSPAGDRPVYSYTSANGVTYTHVASEYGAVQPRNKKDFETKKVIITYLPNNPTFARVEKWQGQYAYGMDIFLGFLICLMSLGFLYSGCKSTTGT